MKNSLVSFFQSVREEIKKVSWPTREQTYQTTFIVIMATIVIGIYVGLIDYGLNFIIQKYVL